MVTLEQEIPKMFKEYNLNCYFNIEKDCYRLTLFDSKSNQTMIFIPKKTSNQVTEIAKGILNFTKKKFPELFSHI